LAKRADKDAPVNVLTHYSRKKSFGADDFEETAFCILIDNLRYDQWKVIQPLVTERFRMKSEETYYSILPTSNTVCTQCNISGSCPNLLKSDSPVNGNQTTAM
jgi:hypothetical protein